MGALLANAAALGQWIQVGIKVFNAGKPAVDSVLAAAAQHTELGDVSALNQAIIELAQIEAEAKAEQQAQS